MLYRDFMQKFRPLYAPDTGASGSGDGAAAAASSPQAEASPAPAATEASPAAAAPSADAPAAPAAGDAAPAGDVAPAATDGGEPSLIEAANAKPDAGATDAGKDKESPAPADAAKPDGDKPQPEADAAKADPDPKDATAESEPPAPIKYDAFTLPEGVKFDDKRFGKFTEIAGKGQVAQDVAQSLIDLHLDEIKNVREQEQKHQHDVWKTLNDTWKTEFRKDDKYGGNRAETTLGMAKAVIEEYGGSPEDVKQFMSHIKANGMGNYLGFIRLMANIGEALNVFEESDQPANPSPPKVARSRSEKWYGNNGAPKA